MQKPGIPNGTRDFSPEKMIKRNFIFENIRKTFQKYGFLPLETPAMENLSVLTGKYGEEGDKLIFKILNSGDFLAKTTSDDFQKGSRLLTGKISEKALRYDLTVPFARYVVMNRNDLTFPFKRYQIQPVWRADRPQKGRYREFYQCDADIVGTDSLICEAELVLLINEVFEKLGLKDITIKINNRKILAGIAEVIGKKGSETELCVAIDKLDKIGQEGVKNELLEKGFNNDSWEKLLSIFYSKQSTESNEPNNLYRLSHLLLNFPNKLVNEGIKEIDQVFEYISLLTGNSKFKIQNLEFDPTLARGLSYYTGAIFEVKANNVSIGSISGGGRYDNLTGVFGLPDVSGVGISFGVDRIYDVLEELNLFPDKATSTTQALVCYFDVESEKYALPVLYKLRQEGINSEVFPEAAKMKKQLGYADSKKIPYVIIIGSEEVKSGELTLKNMLSGDQERLSLEKIIQKLKQ
ncbi:MAG: histidine--tRNA ligase [Cytophagaceae bacterium]|nr:histidine--tRNA ligase [Cytophagaceae bacterium]